MAAYFIQYTYCGYSGITHESDTVITYDKFEKVNKESFYNKISSEINFRNHKDVKIKNVVKL